MKLIASYTTQNRDHTALTNPKTKAWVLGANYSIGAGKILGGYGQKSPDGLPKNKQFSLGYEHSLSKRTYLYVDASRRDLPGVPTSTTVKSNFFDVGVNHAF